MPFTTFQSSGNLAADRRFDYAQGLAARGDYGAAADLHAQALELAPEWAAGWFSYGEVLEKSGQNESAITAFSKALALNAEDPLGAGLHLSRLEGGLSVENHTHIASLFNQYASQFETHLVKSLNYRGPELLRAAMDEVAGRESHFDAFIDLGCGTGLMAQALRGRFSRASGVDLSEKMIKKSQETELFFDLSIGEMTGFLQTRPENSIDLVMAADVFVYCGALEPTFAATRKVLKNSGLFGFSVQRFHGTHFVLGEDYRFAHSAEYIEKAAAETGFVVKILREASTRQDRGADVPGLIVILAPV